MRRSSSSATARGAVLGHGSADAAVGPPIPSASTRTHCGVCAPAARRRTASAPPRRRRTGPRDRPPAARPGGMPVMVGARRGDQPVGFLGSFVQQVAFEPPTVVLAVRGLPPRRSGAGHGRPVRSRGGGRSPGARAAPGAARRARARAVRAQHQGPPSLGPSRGRTDRASAGLHLVKSCRDTTRGWASPAGLGIVDPQARGGPRRAPGRLMLNYATSWLEST